MNALISLPIVLPLFAAGVSIAFGRSRNAQRIIGVLTLTTVSGLAVALLVQVDDAGTTAMQVGGWPAPIGITLVADRFSAIMLVTALPMLLAVLVFAIGQPSAENRHVGFHPVYLVMSAGIAMALLTGDLFNLFVAFEIMLMSSYVLITLGGRHDQVRSGMTYVVISLLASALFLMLLAFVYASTGTLNLADMQGKMAELPPGLQSALAVMAIGVFGIKAAIFPLFFWLPDSYPTAPTAITAVFAGLLTKVGVYAMARTQLAVFPPESRPEELLLIIAGITMVVGVFGAIAQHDVKRILSFHIISQIGYMVMGLGLFTVAGIAGLVLFLVHQIVVKTALFLAAGLVEHRAGTGDLDRIGGLAKLQPVVAVLFLVPALSLAGIPPLSGFVGKLALVDAGFRAEQYVIVGVSLAASLLTMFSMTKIWVNVFWGEPQALPRPLETQYGRPIEWMMVGPAAALLVLSIVIGVAGGPLYELAERAAADLVDPSVYVSAVRGG